MSSETENVNMNIENTDSSNESQGDVKLTGEMLSKVQVSVNMKFPKSLFISSFIKLDSRN